MGALVSFDVAGRIRYFKYKCPKVSGECLVINKSTVKMLLPFHGSPVQGGSTQRPRYSRKFFCDNIKNFKTVITQFCAEKNYHSFQTG